MSSIVSVAIKSTVMLFERLLSLLLGINTRQRLEWTEGLEETARERSQELDGREPSIEVEEKMSHYSQHCLYKDCDKMRPIIIIIDCLVQLAPLGSIHARAYIQSDILLKGRAYSWHHSKHMFTHVLNSRRGSFSRHFISCFVSARSCLVTRAAFSKYRYGGAVAVQGRLPQLLWCLTGAGCAGRGRRGAQVLHQLIGGAKLHLEKECENT